MPVTLNELLHPQVIVDTITKVQAGKGALSSFMGWDLGSGKVKKVETRYASFRIFNQTREPATFRAPGTGPAVTPPNPVGEQRVQMSRAHEKIILDAEQLGNLAVLSGPNAQIDRGGQDYIAHQERFLGVKFNQAVEVLCAGFVRGQLYLSISGDNFVPALTTPAGTYLTIDFQLPAGNKSQLDMLGAGSIIDVSWDNDSAPIVKHILNVRAAMVQLTGMQLTHILVNSSTWFHIINNIGVRTIGGVVQSPFESFSYVDQKDQDGKPMAGMGMATLRAIPWVKFVIIDDLLSIGGSDPVYSTGTGTLTKVVPDNVAVFMPDPDPLWANMWHGGELVCEDYAQKKMDLKVGFSAWSRFDIEPTAISIVALLNALPVPYRSNAWAYGTVIF